MAQEYDIQRQVDALRIKVLNQWKREGKWDGDNHNAPYYGIEKDPLLTVLLTAFVFQANGIDNEIREMKDGFLDEFEDMLLPYYITQAVPAMSMVATAKPAEYTDDLYVDSEEPFLVKRDTMKVKEYYPFHPLFKVKVVGATVADVKKMEGEKWMVVLNVTDRDASLGSMSFYFENVVFQDVNLTFNAERVPLIKPWDFERFPMNPWFESKNILNNKSLIYGATEIWSDLWVRQNINYFMVDPSYNKTFNGTVANLVFEFGGIAPNFTLSPDNVILNSFPVVNVTKKDFTLSATNPIVKLSDESAYAPDGDSYMKVISGNTPENSHQDFFMHFVMNPDTRESDFDSFSLRHFGAERFNLDELMRLTAMLSKRYESDFYAFQSVTGLQNNDRARRLDIVVKDILNVVKEVGLPQTGVYAMLKRNVSSSFALHLSGLFTDGANANDIDRFSSVMPPKDFDKKETRMLMNTVGGRDEITDKEEKKLLAKYYFQTTDRIVTRADLKAFCIRFITQWGISRNDILGVPTTVEYRKGIPVQRIFVQLRAEGVRHREDLRSLVTCLKKMIAVRSANVTPIELLIQLK